MRRLGAHIFAPALGLSRRTGSSRGMVANLTRLAPDPTRRSERARRAILSAAFELCRERGYDRMSVEAIADRAGVGKQTIYRWWPSKGAVILDALNDYVGDVSDFPDSGDVRADLRQQMSGVSALLGSEEFGPVYRAVIASAQSDPELARALSEGI